MASRRTTPSPPAAPITIGPSVSAGDLLEVLSARRRVVDLSEQLRIASALLAEAEHHVIRMLKSGAEVASETHTAVVIVDTGAISPRWKEEFKTHMEIAHEASWAAFEAEVRTRYQPSKSERLVIAHRIRKGGRE